MRDTTVTPLEAPESVVDHCLDLARRLGARNPHPVVRRNIAACLADAYRGDRYDEADHYDAQLRYLDSIDYS